MATTDEWSVGYARQAAADFNTFNLMQSLDVPDCHKLQFLQMACEKLVKGHLRGAKTPQESIQSSHAYISANLPRVLRQEAIQVNYEGPRARQVLERAKLLANEIELLAPSVKRGGQRPDNCEYPWEDITGCLHVPLDWAFNPSQLIIAPSGRTILKLVQGAINRLVKLRLS